MCPLPAKRRKGRVLKEEDHIYKQSHKDMEVVVELWGTALSVSGVYIAD